MMVVQFYISFVILEYMKGFCDLLDGVIPRNDLPFIDLHCLFRP
jgi:hypothetical protein